ncbi:hypothetical protein IVB30_22475 [Bradyrhizobium sp. 200]|uniref:hypothetical protein n=1 Tax=Bradyrhizobium sp. 200 TaxID=2782665 RepID=UPI001FFFD732|nr:hypothetical protein [Bradyrhizobium sp. 200]UPJ53830.1 hypothetical protein IVB30_22475 [Bradyrhizobium sp. 200]
MPTAARHAIPITLLAMLIAVAVGAGLSHAQTGSSGGSIGNDEKSLSGSRDAPRATEFAKPARRSQPEADEPRRTGRKSGGGGGNFDGAWMVYSRGVTCQGTGSNAVVVTSGKIIGESARGTVSPDGRVYGTSTGNGITVITTGRLSGRSGGGTFRQSDGCTGTWTASKQ